MTPTAMHRSKLFPVLQGVSQETAAARIEVLQAQARAAKVPVEAHARTVYVSGDGVLCLRWTAIAQRIDDSGRFRVVDIVAKADRALLGFLEREEDATWSWAVLCEDASCGVRETISMDNVSERPRNCRACTASALAVEVPSGWRWRGCSDWTLARAVAAGALSAIFDQDGESFDPAKDPLPTLRRRALIEGARMHAAPIFFGVAIEGELAPDAPAAPAPTNGNGLTKEGNGLLRDRSGEPAEIARVVPSDASMEEILDLPPGEGLSTFPPAPARELDDVPTAPGPRGLLIPLPTRKDEPVAPDLALAIENMIAKTEALHATNTDGGATTLAPESPQGVPAAGAEGAQPSVPGPSTDSGGGRADPPAESSGPAAVADPVPHQGGTVSPPALPPVPSAPPAPEEEPPSGAGGGSYTSLYVALSSAAWEANAVRLAHGEDSDAYRLAKFKTDTARERLRAAATCEPCGHGMCDHAPEGCEVEGCDCALSGYDAEEAATGPDGDDPDDDLPTIARLVPADEDPCPSCFAPLLSGQCMNEDCDVDVAAEWIAEQERADFDAHRSGMGGPLTVPTAEQVNVVSNVATSTALPPPVAVEDEVTRRRARAAAWALRPFTKAAKASRKDPNAPRPLCAECERPVAIGEAFWRGLDGVFPPGQRCKGPVPIGLCHATCRERLSHGVDPKAETVEALVLDERGIGVRHEDPKATSEVTT